MIRPRTAYPKRSHLDRRDRSCCSSSNGVPLPPGALGGRAGRDFAPPEPSVATAGDRAAARDRALPWLVCCDIAQESARRPGEALARRAAVSRHLFISARRRRHPPRRPQRDRNPENDGRDRASSDRDGDRRRARRKPRLAIDAEPVDVDRCCGLLDGKRRVARGPTELGATVEVIDPALARAVEAAPERDRFVDHERLGERAARIDRERPCGRDGGIDRAERLGERAVTASSRAVVGSRRPRSRRKDRLATIDGIRATHGDAATRALGVGRARAGRSASAVLGSVVARRGAERDDDGAEKHAGSANQNAALIVGSTLHGQAAFLARSQHVAATPGSAMLALTVKPPAPPAPCAHEVIDPSLVWLGVVTKTTSMR